MPASALRRAAGPLGSVDAVRAGNRVVLTYDDGPEPGGTEGVLDALAQAGVRATFFVLLTRVRRYPGLLDAVLAAGHEVALHGIDHRPLPAFGAREARRRCADGRAELEDRIARPVRWLRPPYGRLTVGTRAAVSAAGLTPVLWGPSTRDTEPGTVAERAGRATVTAGAILLSHDGFAGGLREVADGVDDGVDDGPAPRFDRGAVAAEVIARYRAAGLEPGALGDAASTGSLRRSLLLSG